MENSAWSKLRDATLRAENGAQDALLRFDPATAAAAIAAARPELGQTSSASRAAGVQEGLEHAGRYLEAFLAAVPSGSVVIRYGPESADTPVEGVVLTGDEAGFTVKTGPRVRPKRELVPLATVTADPTSFFVALPSGGDPLDHAAFLGYHAVAAHMQAARAYLARIDPDDDASGTGDAGFALAQAGVDAALARLADAEGDWVQALRSELESARLLGRALRAMSSQRNLSAAGLLEELLRDHAQTWLLRCLL